MKNTAKALVTTLIISMIPVNIPAEELPVANMETAQDVNVEVFDEIVETIDMVQNTEEDISYLQSAQVSSEEVVSEKQEEVSNETEEIPAEETVLNVAAEEEDLLESSGITETSTAEEDPEADFVKKAFGSEEAAVTSRAGNSALVCDGYGVLFVAYEDDSQKPVSAYKWDTSDRWYFVNGDGNSRLLEAGIYPFYGNTEWMIGANGAGLGGYDLSEGMWSYYLGNGDISNGYASEAGYDGSLPELLYHGAKWTGDKVLTVKSGLHNYKGNQYFLKKDGTVLTDSDFCTNGKSYHSDENGICTEKEVEKNSWQYTPAGFYVRIDENGKVIRDGGFYEIDGNTYFICGHSGRQARGWLTYRGKNYYFDPDTGVIQTGYQVIDGVPYYLNESEGRLGQVVTGDPFIDGARYHFEYNEDGSLVTGWITGGKDGTNKYYVNPDGSMKLGWQRFKDLNKTFYFDTKWGYALKGIQTIEGKKYLFVSGGAVGRRWNTYDGNKYYSDPVTAELKTGFLELNDTKYYFDESGKLLIDKPLYRIDGTYYSIDKNGKCTAIHDQLITADGKQYYVDADGNLVMNKDNYEINEKLYDIDKNGVAVAIPEVRLLARETLNEAGGTLYDAYQWSILPYERKTHRVPEDMDPAEYYALYGFRNGYGNCYVMAATFYQMAKELGFDAHFVMGYVPLARGGYGPHGWVEIDQNGGTYVYDPDYEYDEGVSGYKIYYGKPGTWMYTGYDRVN